MKHSESARERELREAVHRQFSNYRLSIRQCYEWFGPGLTNLIHTLGTYLDVGVLLRREAGSQDETSDIPNDIAYGRAVRCGTALPMGGDRPLLCMSEL